MCAAIAARAMSELYKNAVCLAPMVRAGTLPLRLLSLRYGADLVYSEEIIDKRIIATTRIENAVLNTVDFVTKNSDVVVFSTCAEERQKVVFQIGTADPYLALQAARQVEKDVAAIDVNMGCPKHFSVQGGMGAALLKKQDVACEIVRTLSSNLSIPVSAKIRLLETTEATIAFAKALQEAGAVAIGLHAREAHERPADEAHWDRLRPVVEALYVPVLVNGDIFTREDLAAIHEASGATSFLIARGAMTNASVFRKAGMLPASEVVKEYLKLCAETNNVYQNSKYLVSRMIPSKLDESTPSDAPPVTVAELGATRRDAQMFELFGVLDVYDSYQAKFKAKAIEVKQTLPEGQQPAHHYDDVHLVNREFFCELCNMQLLSAKDVEVHNNGRRHRNMAKGEAPRASNGAEVVADKRFFCDICNLQLLSEKDMALHVVGKRHKKIARTVAALAEQQASESATADAAADQEPPQKRAKVDVEQEAAQSPVEVANKN